MTRVGIIQGGGGNGRLTLEVKAQLEEKLGITFDALYGISSGAIDIAAHSYLGARPACIAYDDNIKCFLDVFSPRLDIESGVLDMDPIRESLHKLFDGKQAKIPYTVGMVDWDYGENHYVQCQNHPKAIECVLASASIPIMCSPIPNDGLIGETIEAGFCDGGTCSLTPLSAALEGNFDELYVIMCQPPRSKMDKFTPIEFPLFPFIQLVQRSLRALDILMHARMMDDLEWKAELKPGQKLFILAPETAPWNDVDFSPEANQSRVVEATAMVDRFRASRQKVFRSKRHSIRSGVSKLWKKASQKLRNS